MGSILRNTRNLYAIKTLSANGVTRMAQRNCTKSVSNASIQELPDLDKIDFTDAKKAFEKKSFQQLVRGYTVFGLCSFGTLVDNQKKILSTIHRLLGTRLFMALVRHTLYGQFMLGEGRDEVVSRAQQGTEEGVLVIMGYTAPEIHGDTVSTVSADVFKEMFRNNLKNMHTSIDYAAEATQGHKIRPKTAFKLTFFATIDCLSHFNAVIRDNNAFVQHAIDNKTQTDLEILRHTLRSVRSDLPLYKSSETMDITEHVTSFTTSVPFHLELYKTRKVKNQVSPDVVFSDEDAATVTQLCEDMRLLGEHAIREDVRILWDAEQLYVQDAIDILVLDAMRKHNHQKPVHTNTYQCYRTRTLGVIRRDLDLARREGFHLGLKCVRGAYIDEERRLAKERGYDDPIQPSYEATTQNYYNVVDCLMENITAKDPVPVQITFGSHNLDTIKYIVARMRELGVPADGNVVAMAQTGGMRDYITYPIGGLGLPVCKQYHYGSVQDGLAWLSRRITENRGGVPTVDMERKMLGTELRRRMFRLG